MYKEFTYVTKLVYNCLLVAKCVFLLYIERGKRMDKMIIKRVKISQLIKDPSNVRLHNEKNLMAIKGSLAKFGQQKPLVINKKNIVLAGNGTLEAALSLGWTEINVVISELEGIDSTAYAIADNRTSELAQWDSEGLGLTLKALHDEEYDFSAVGFDEDDLESFWPDEDKKDDEEGSKYSNKIEAPIYTPNGEKPEFKTIFDTEKYKVLIDEIDKSNLSEDEKEFLKLAATRHIIFNYEKIAEYYCHISQEMQMLMEKSALVIIDYNKAVENSFVSLTKELMEIYDNDQL